MTFQYTAGSDEAGYGAWAGPLTVAGVRTPLDWTPPRGLTDSKKLSEAQRETLYLALMRDPTIVWKVVSVPVSQIDRVGVHGCLRQAHESVHQALSEGVEGVRCIADGTLALRDPIESIPKADSLFAAVSAASIIAKVTRDREMVGLSGQFPGYGFDQHKGYGVPAHEAALRNLGPCQMHRMSYGPLASFAKKKASLFDELAALPQE